MTPASLVRVANFDFAESQLLAKMSAQVLEAAGVPVERIAVVWPREITVLALELVPVVRTVIGPNLVGEDAGARSSAEPE